MSKSIRYENYRLTEQRRQEQQRRLEERRRLCAEQHRLRLEKERRQWLHKAGLQHGVLAQQLTAITVNTQQSPPEHRRALQALESRLQEIERRLTPDADLSALRGARTSMERLKQELLMVQGQVEAAKRQNQRERLQELKSLTVTHLERSNQFDRAGYAQVQQILQQVESIVGKGDTTGTARGLTKLEESLRQHLEETGRLWQAYQNRYLEVEHALQELQEDIKAAVNDAFLTQWAGQRLTPVTQAVEVLKTELRQRPRIDQLANMIHRAALVKADLARMVEQAEVDHSASEAIHDAVVALAGSLKARGFNVRITKPQPNNPVDTFRVEGRNEHGQFLTISLPSAEGGRVEICDDDGLLPPGAQQCLTEAGVEVEWPGAALLGSGAADQTILHEPLEAPAPEASRYLDHSSGDHR